MQWPHHEQKGQLLNGKARMLDSGFTSRWDQPLISSEPASSVVAFYLISLLWD